MHTEFAVYIGRFQPFHLGHVHVINEALQDSQNLVIFIGSASESRTAKNPFTYEERADVISTWAHDNNLTDRVFILPIMDEPTDERWIKYLTTAIRTFTKSSTSTVMVGHDKDDSSWYLKAFPQYGVKLVHNYENLSATCLRKSLFIDHTPVAFIKDSIPDATKEFLINFKVFQSREFKSVCQLSEVKEPEATVEPEVKEPEAVVQPTVVATEYPRIDHTADCIVLGTYDGCATPYILLIKRKNEPGKGEWALPGGFVEVGETILESAYRELEEETSIYEEQLIEDVPTGYTFDYPCRDPRGRIITTAFVLELEGNIDYLNFAPMDDAEEAEWFPLSSTVLGALPVFLDHEYIIGHCLEKENISTIA